MLKTMIVSFTMTVLILSGCAAAENNHSEATPALPNMPFTAESLKAFANPDDYQHLFALTPFKDQKVDDWFLKDHYIEIESHPMTYRKDLVTYELPGSLYLSHDQELYNEETRHFSIAVYGWTLQGKLTSLRRDGYIKEDWLSLAQFPELRRVTYAGFDSGSDIDIDWLAPLKNLEILILQRRRLFHINDLCHFTQLKHFSGSTSYPQEPIRFKNCQAPLTLLSYETARLDDIEVSDLPSLVHLNFSEAKIHKLAIDGDSLPNLEYLELRETQLPADLSQVNLPDSLIQLSLGKQTSASLSQLTLPKNLKYLNLRGAQLDDYSFIATAESLESLNLRESNFDNWALLSQLKNLKHLNLSGTTISESNLKYLLPLKDIQFLSIGDSNISNFLVLQPLQKIRTLVLSGVSINDYSNIPYFQSLIGIVLPKGEEQIKDIDQLPEHIQKMIWASRMERDISMFDDEFLKLNPMVRYELNYGQSCNNQASCSIAPWLLKD